MPGGFTTHRCGITAGNPNRWHSQSPFSAFDRRGRKGLCVNDQSRPTRLCVGGVTRCANGALDNQEPTEIPARSLPGRWRCIQFADRPSPLCAWLDAASWAHLDVSPAARTPPIRPPLSAVQCDIPILQLLGVSATGPDHEILSAVKNETLVR